MIYESIPDLVTAAVRSIYRVSYVDVQAYTPARLWEFIETNKQIASIGGALSAVSLVLCVVFAAFIIFVVMQKRALKSSQDTKDEITVAEPAGALSERWNSISAHLDSPREADWKVALLEADTLVDDALAKAGFAGATFGDRLSNIQPGTLLSLDGVWWAHKVRNRLAHESDYFLRYTEARQAIGYFEAALTELQLL
jgi:hypothetical protein